MNNCEKKDGPMKLNIPENIEVENAYKVALAGLPVALMNLEENTEQMAGALDIIASYLVKKGRQEDIFAIDEHQDFLDAISEVDEDDEENGDAPSTAG